MTRSLKDAHDAGLKRTHYTTKKERVQIVANALFATNLAATQTTSCVRHAEQPFEDDTRKKEKLVCAAAGRLAMGGLAAGNVCYVATLYKTWVVTRTRDAPAASPSLTKRKAKGLRNKTSPRGAESIRMKLKRQRQRQESHRKLNDG